MPRSDQIHIRITPELKNDLQARADAEGVTISQHVTKLIAQDIAENTKGADPMTNEEVSAFATIFAACWWATGSHNAAELNNAQSYPILMATVYVRKLHAMQRSTPKIEQILMEQYSKIRPDALESIHRLLPLEQQGVWNVAFNQTLYKLKHG